MRTGAVMFLGGLLVFFMSLAYAMAIGDVSNESLGKTILISGFIAFLGFKLFFRNTGKSKI